MADSTLSLLLQGYAWLPDRRRRSGGAPVRTRLLGKRVIALHGPAAVRFFYDEEHIHRQGALPEPVIDTLFGQGAVHTLDGEPHRARKGMFLHLLKDPEGVRALTDRVALEWKDAVAGWAVRGRVVLFDEVAGVLTRAVHAWAGVPLTEGEADGVARDLVAMVDGFASAGPRQLRARVARRRQERRLARLVERERDGGDSAVRATPFRTVVHHRDADGALLDPRTAAVEVLNIVRPTVAVSWFAVFAAHALHRWPEHRAALRDGDPAFALAFAQEVRRFYPFAPFIGGLAADRLDWEGRAIRPGTLVLLDLYGQNHDPDLWPRPYVFDPARFHGTPVRPDELVPQGGGDPAAGHRCPGEDITLALLSALAVLLSGLAYRVPEQDLSIPLHRVPTAPRSGFVIEDVR
ncbi:cytochrome P450 [Streptomyces drozdowiczii]|uniref:Cytochrome P450 n=1 Tax=Streptomyces drozdowiczii TaxID=202862 RepID=A0ABY6PLD7_9ACTN|nr:cytochrome P450 [Streptomyces drozdowiczii]MCX0247598.1 cytochrome P450 [Streptomyces drozdowiczii]UZK53023.1 cytochrome P450 [Streptomyces drozdowiczii]